jgi:prepilin-type N-terminal cleavage/methylation domain-containing protein
MGARGYTLVEALVAVVVVGLLVLIGIPRAQGLLAQSNVRGARTALAGVIQQSRMRAIRESRSITLHFTDSTVWVSATPRRSAGAAPCRCDTVGTAVNVKALHGVSVSVTPDSLRLDPRGIGALPGTGGLSVVLSRSGVVESVSVNPLGRLH